MIDSHLRVDSDQMVSETNSTSPPSLGMPLGHKGNFPNKASTAHAQNTNKMADCEDDASFEVVVPGEDKKIDTAKDGT